MKKNKTTIPVSPDVLEGAAATIRALTGVDFTPDKWNELSKKIINLSNKLRVGTPESLFNQIAHNNLSDSLKILLIEEITVNETFFMRDKRSLNFLVQEIIPKLLASNPHNKVNIWSAACSSGEEVYSLKILFHEFYPQRDIDRIHIIGSDINTRVLNKARDGEFGSWSFRGVAERIKNKYFIPVKNGKNYKIKDFLKQNVEFKNINLIQLNDYRKLEPYRPIDLILCRNVFIYFSRNEILKASEYLKQYLAPNGLLVTGMAEANKQNFPSFHSVHYPGIIVFSPGAPGMPAQKEKNTIRPLPKPSSLSIQKNKSSRKRTSLKRTPPIDYLEIAKEQIELLQKNIDSGNYMAAAHCFSQIQAISPKIKLPSSLSSVLLTLEASLLLSRGEHENASAKIEQAIQLNPVNPRAFYVKAMLLIEQDSIEAAIKNLDKVIFLDPSHLMSFYMKAILLRLSGSSHVITTRILNNTLNLLSSLPEDETVALSDGMTVGGLKKHILNLQESERTNS